MRDNRTLGDCVRAVVLNENAPEPKEYHVVTNKNHSNGPDKVVGKYKSASRARNARDKKDNEYGSYAHSIKHVYEDTFEETVEDTIEESPTVAGLLAHGPAPIRGGKKVKIKAPKPIKKSGDHRFGSEYNKYIHKSYVDSKGRIYAGAGRTESFDGTSAKDVKDADEDIGPQDSLINISNGYKAMPSDRYDTGNSSNKDGASLKGVDTPSAPTRTTPNDSDYEYEKDENGHLNASNEPGEHSGFTDAPQHTASGYGDDGTKSEQFGLNKSLIEAAKGAMAPAYKAPVVGDNIKLNRIGSPIETAIRIEDGRVTTDRYNTYNLSDILRDRDMVKIPITESSYGKMNGPSNQSDPTTHPFHSTIVGAGFKHSGSSLISTPNGGSYVSHTFSKGKHEVTTSKDEKGNDYWIHKSSPRANTATAGKAVALQKHLNNVNHADSALGAKGNRKTGSASGTGIKSTNNTKHKTFGQHIAKTIGSAIKKGAHDVLFGK